MSSDSQLPMDARRSTVAVGERDRERVVRHLGEHFAHDRLTLEEYEFRVQEALRATQWYELAAITSDMPAIDDAESPTVAPSGLVTALRQTVVAIMGGVVRKGQWLVPSRLRSIAVMGGVSLDLRDATLSSPVTDVYAVAIMGGIDIVVPPGVRLECDGVAIMGGFDQEHDLSSVGRSDAPVIRVRGLACMGGVTTRTKLRGVDDEDDA